MVPNTKELRPVPDLNNPPHRRAHAMRPCDLSKSDLSELPLSPGSADVPSASRAHAMRPYNPSKSDLTELLLSPGGADVPSASRAHAMRPYDPRTSDPSGLQLSPGSAGILPASVLSCLVTFQHILLTIVLALGAANPAFAQTSQDFIYSRRVNSDPTRLLQQGMALLRSNHNEEAAEKFERLCAINPNSARAHYFWGLSLLKLGRTVEATDQLKQAIRIDSQLADAWLTLAGIYQATGDTDQAIRTYREFVSRFPQDNDAQRAGGLLALLTKQNSIGQSNNDSVTASPSNGFNNPAILPTPNSAAMNQPARLPTTDTQVAAQPDYYPEIIAHGLMRWTSQQMPLAVFIDSDYPRKGTATNYPAVLKAAFLDWASKSQGFVNFVFTPGLPKANIVCRWSEDCSKFNSNGEAAETRLYGSQSGLARGEIEILVLSPLAKTPLTEEQMRGIALHEIGHVLGLAGHSKNQDDIMFFSPYKVDYWHGISSRDQATLARLYSQK